MRLTEILTFVALAVILWRLLILDSVVVMSTRRTQTLFRRTMSEVQDAVDAVVAQIGKAKDEIVAEIAALEAREPSVDLSGLKAAAQALDDLNPDPAPPVDVPPADVPPAA